MAGKDNWLLSNKTWLNWMALSNGNRISYNNKYHTKPKDGELLKKHHNMIKNKNNEARRQKRLKTDGTDKQKRSQVKYEDEIDRVKDHPSWKEWISLKSSANNTLSFHGRYFKRTFLMIQKSS
jgi:hypothetical protein